MKIIDAWLALYRATSTALKDGDPRYKWTFNIYLTGKMFTVNVFADDGVNSERRMNRIHWPEPWLMDTETTALTHLRTLVQELAA